MTRAVVVLVALALAAGCGPKKPSSSAKSDPMRHYQLGVELLKQGLADRAVIELERAYQSDPGSPLITYALGLSYYATRNLPRAEKAFLNALDLDPFFTDAHNSLGIVYGEQGQWAKARASFERVLADKRYRTPEVARFNIGRSYLGEGNAEVAAQHMRIAVEAKPEQIDWRLQYGIALMRMSRWAEAKGEFEAVLARTPDSVDGNYQLGLASMNLRETARAREAFGRVIQLAPGSPEAERSSQYLRELGS